MQVSQLETRPLIGWLARSIFWSTNQRPGFQLTYVSKTLMLPKHLYMIRPQTHTYLLLIIGNYLSYTYHIISTCFDCSIWAFFGLLKKHFLKETTVHKQDGPACRLLLLDMLAACLPVPRMYIRKVGHHSGTRSAKLWRADCIFTHVMPPGGQVVHFLVSESYKRQMALQVVFFSL